MNEFRRAETLSTFEKNECPEGGDHDWVNKDEGDVMFLIFECSKCGEKDYRQHPKWWQRPA